MNLIEREPVVTANTIVALVSALLVLGVSFGAPVSEEQRTAIIAVVVIIAPFVAAWWARQRVTPVADPRDNQGHRLVRASKL